jgi:hypothetical protein
MIVEEVSTRKKETYGYTAEQIVEKLERDSTAVAILNHLVKSVKPRELERLLEKVIPEKYFDLLIDAAEDPINHQYPEHLQSVLEQCYRLSFDSVSDDVRTTITSRFVSILKEEDEFRVLNYETAFFKAKDLRYLSKDDIEFHLPY